MSWPQGQKAYEIYVVAVDGKNYQGLPCPEWNDLTDKIKEAWATVETQLRSPSIEDLAGSFQDIARAEKIIALYSNGTYKFLKTRTGTI